MRIEELNGWYINVVAGEEPHPETGELTQTWTLILTEGVPPTGNQIRISFLAEVRDDLVAKLQSGIVPARGNGDIAAALAARLTDPPQ